ncbi:MAG: DUF3035 domain-containing protein [Rhodobacteraceae bacterium]|nr:DUF3035 domain-containing protein [Paracoccaceae bacterium]
MRSEISVIAMACAAVLFLSACSLRGGSEEVLSPKSGAKLRPTDEFSAAPSRPIELPESVANLPRPSKARPDRAQKDAAGEALAALGGRRGGGNGGIPAGDREFVAYASRLGTDKNIRLLLAAEDEEFRRGRQGKLLERWFNVNLYFRAYEEMTLDEYAELERLRRSDVRTPSAPPRSEN